MMSPIYDETLIRLKDTNNENKMFSAFYTNHPSEYLKMYYFCQKNNISITLKEKDIEGWIEDIEVSFGSNENIPCIDIWIET